jgi:uncharacterized protein (TIGR04255 family)
MFCFPDVGEVPLGRSPISEVICQIKFPLILRITRETPVDFQERIRDRFPEMEIERRVNIELDKSDPTALETKPAIPIFRFKSEDRRTVVSLSAGFYALSTRAYTHWADFQAMLRQVHQAAREVYDLPYASRVGLRYVNVLKPGTTRAETMDALLDVLRPELTTLLQSRCWSMPEEMLSQLALVSDDGTRLTLRSGYQGDREGEGPSFLLDFDAYVERRTALDEVAALSNEFHDIIYRAFRWCIREDGLDIFEPVGDR